MMSVDLRFGASNSLKLNFNDQQSVSTICTEVDSLDGTLKEMVQSSLDQSVHFPAFREIVFPEDRLAIAVGEGIPRIAEIIASILDYLQAFTEVAAEDITIVLPHDEMVSVQTRLEMLLDEFVYTTLQFEIHHPDVPEEQAYLTATAEGEPIRLNKTLVDADVVLPVCSNLPEPRTGYAGFFHDLFPLFTESEAILRYRAAPDAGVLKRDSEEAVNMLGVQYLVKVTPASGEQIHNVTAGDIYTLQSSVTSMADSVWKHTVSEAELSIGTLAGETQQQTWDNLARALVTLSKTTSPGGSIVLCSELSGPLPGSIKLLTSNEAHQHVKDQLEQQPDADILAAREILRLRNDYHIYLLSNLAGEDVESIGLANIETPSQINNLIAPATTINCLGDAHRVALA